MSLGDEFGMVEFLDQRGKPCAYCGRESTRTLVVQPSSGGGKHFKKGVRVGVCDEHFTTPQPPPPADTYQERKDRMHEHLRFDV